MKNKFNNGVTMMKMKRNIYFNTIKNTIEPVDKNSYHMNCNNIMKSYKNINVK